jgi:capsule polysaccharide export protein KpsC/LpsZ
MPNDSKIFQMAIKTTSVFHSKAPKNLPKLEFLVWKRTIWQPWLKLQKCAIIQKTVVTYVRHSKLLQKSSVSKFVCNSAK